MTKQEAINEHNEAVELRRKFVKEGKETEHLDRHISRLGQIHNPRISRKAKKALGL